MLSLKVLPLTISINYIIIYTCIHMKPNQEIKSGEYKCHNVNWISAIKKSTV